MKFRYFHSVQGFLYGKKYFFLLSKDTATSLFPVLLLEKLLIAAFNKGLPKSEVLVIVNQ